MLGYFQSQKAPVFQKLIESSFVQIGTETQDIYY